MASLFRYRLLATLINPFAKEGDAALWHLGLALPVDGMDDECPVARTVGGKPNTPSFLLTTCGYLIAVFLVEGIGLVIETVDAIV